MKVLFKILVTTSEPAAHGMDYAGVPSSHAWMRVWSRWEKRLTAADSAALRCQVRAEWADDSTSRPSRRQICLQHVQRWRTLPGRPGSQQPEIVARDCTRKLPRSRKSLFIYSSAHNEKLNPALITFFNHSAYTVFFRSVASVNIKMLTTSPRVLFYWTNTTFVLLLGRWIRFSVRGVCCFNWWVSAVIGPTCIYRRLFSLFDHFVIVLKVIKTSKNHVIFVKSVYLFYRPRTRFSKLLKKILGKS